MSSIGKFEDMISDMGREGSVNFTKDGKCSNCGACCSNFLLLSKSDISRIKRYIIKNNIKAQVRNYPTSEMVVDMMCPFRDEIGKKCTIYEVRPEICRVYKCDKSLNELREGYGRSGNLSDMRDVFFDDRNTLGLIMHLKGLGL